MSPQRARGLGRGLQSLIPIAPGAEGQDAGLPQYIDVDQIRPSPEQTRRQFPAEPLRELADSIRLHGVLQPVLVRRLTDGYELIAGERRWRAARLAGVEHIPAIVRRDAEPQESLLLGLIENLQREDLDPIEEARGIKRLIEQFGLTHEDAAARLGKHRVAVTQALRLLTAGPAVISATSAGAITAGHARALVSLPSPEAQEHGLKVVLGRNLSVRETERWVRDYQPSQPRRRPARSVQAGDEVHGEMAQLLALLQQRYGNAVGIAGSRSEGLITLRYNDAEALDKLVQVLLQAPPVP
ncbi:MAG TPA: ParB/RepB/Spo0J family partition protein [Candidatus Dormibacteraeota bacterium]|nr:ParB/RepB/Spo0J family partition protein [Candidatus Dormibacteraeota bacterium]